MSNQTQSLERKLLSRSCRSDCATSRRGSKPKSSLTGKRQMIGMHRDSERRETGSRGSSKSRGVGLNYRLHKRGLMTRKSSRSRSVRDRAPRTGHRPSKRELQGLNKRSRCSRNSYSKPIGKKTITLAGVANWMMLRLSSIV